MDRGSPKSAEGTQSAARPSRRPAGSRRRPWTRKCAEGTQSADRPRRFGRVGPRKCAEGTQFIEAEMREHPPKEPNPHAEPPRNRAERSQSSRPIRNAAASRIASSAGAERPLPGASSPSCGVRSRANEAKRDGRRKLFPRHRINSASGAEPRRERTQFGPGSGAKTRRLGRRHVGRSRPGPMGFRGVLRLRVCVGRWEESGSIAARR
jgi:hypothetical protein